MAEYGLSSNRIWRRAGQPEKIIALVLLFILLTAAAAGVTSVLISPNWGLLWRGLLFGLLFGWVLALLRQPAWRSALIIITIGAAYALLFTGGLIDKGSAILLELGNVFSRFAASRGYPHADLIELGELQRALIFDVGVVIDRVRLWITALLAAEGGFDPVAAALVWSIMVWLVAAWAGWIVEARRNALLAAFPAVLLSLGALSYGRYNSSAIYVMLGAILLLLAIVQHGSREQMWDETGVAYPPRKGRQVGGTALLLALGLVALSAVLSSISLPRLLEWVSADRESDPAQEGGLGESLGIRAVATATQDMFEDIRHPGLPREKLIGSGPELSRVTVMTVAVEDFPGVLKDGQSHPFYWRGFTYDVYTGHGWRTSSTSLSEYQAGQLLGSEGAQDHLLIQQTMRFIGREVNTLFTAGEPVSVNHPSLGAWRSPEDLFGVLVGSLASYQAYSLFPAIDVDVLRSAGQDYPEWVRRRYLALPPQVPQRLIELAFKLTATERTPYDRARAIESHLRQIPYSLDVPYPPLDQDLVDFFLFDLRQGYCDYYASAMVVLARAAGLPARIAVGYASGTYDLNSRRFHVTEADAHTWVEIYFPVTGWVPFEPTAGRPSFDSTQNRESASVQNQIPDEVAPVKSSDSVINGIWLIVLGGGAAVGLTGAVWAAYDEIRLQRLSEPDTASEIYRRLRRYAMHLGSAPESGDTPFEVADALIHQLHQQSPSEPEEGRTALRIEQVGSLTGMIVHASYHPYPTLDEDIYQKWKRLRWQLRMAWLQGQIYSLRAHFLDISRGLFRRKPAATLQET